MKKLKTFFLTVASITILTSCSNDISPKKNDASISESTSFNTELDSFTQEEPQSSEINEPTSETLPDIDDSSWDFITDNYPLVTYDEVKSGNYVDQYVILSATVDSVDYFEYTNWITCNVWFSHENSYICNNITFRCDELPNYSPKTLQAGDNINICFLIYRDNSFGSAIKGFNKNDNPTSLEDIYNLFKQNCSPINWEEVMRSPDSLWGTTYSCTGNVFQIISDENNRIELLLSIDKDKYIHISYTYKPDDLKLLEDDTITVYGTFYQLYKYTSVLGTNHSVPSIVAEFIETTAENSAINKEPKPLSETEELIPEHRTGKEIIGISDKDISDLNLKFYESVKNDVTGRWRLAVISEDIDIQDYIFSYYKKYYKNDNEIHGIVNPYKKITTRINYVYGMLFVTELTYVDGEEHDAKLLYSGTPIKSYIVYTDNGDIEKDEEN